MSYNYCNNYSLLSYLEYPILLLQEYVLIYLVVKYQRLMGTKSFIVTGIYVTVLLGFLSKILPTAILTMLIVSFD